ncbi:MAG: hypothetical protein FWE34_07105 [Defluviitaleaceae bacterium]|nr:hypothetical protein [Defluviitaleaceae bacterium]
MSEIVADNHNNNDSYAILGLIDEEEYGAIDVETFRILSPRNIVGTNKKATSVPKPLTLWLKNINEDGYIANDKVKRLLEKAVGASVDEFIKELQT